MVYKSIPNNPTISIEFDSRLLFQSMADNGDQSQSRNVQYPHDLNCYRILSQIGSGGTALVYKAICLPMNSTLVAIKSIDLDQSKIDLNSVRREINTMSLLSHPNIVHAHCSFIVGHHLWVVMPFMSAGSLQSIISYSFPDGLNELCFAIVLKETLKALCYLHDQGHLHRDIKAGNILMDSNGSVKLADFGVSASIYESNLSASSSGSSSSSLLMFTDVTGTSYWMAPEVLHSPNGYSFKADVWSFGITALELAYGRPPLSHLPLSKSLLMKITRRFRFSDIDMINKEKKNKKFSKSFEEMVKSCLQQEPSKRPTATELLKHAFFRNCRNSEFLVRNLLVGLPSVEQRFEETKLLKQVPSASINRGNKEDDQEESSSSMITKQRRISGWNFNENGFELDPVYPTDEVEDTYVMKQVRVGGETIIGDAKDPKSALDSNEPDLSSCGRVLEQEQAIEEEEPQPQEGNEAQVQLVDQVQPIEYGQAIAYEYETEQVQAQEFGQAQFNDVGQVQAHEGNQDLAYEVGQAQAHLEGGIDSSGELNQRMLPSLFLLRRSLEDQRQYVILLINMLGGGDEATMELSREAQLRNLIERLRVDLDEARDKNFKLEMELEILKLNISGGAHPGSSSSGGDPVAAEESWVDPGI